MDKFEKKVNNTIYKEGDKSKYLYFIEKGEIAVVFPLIVLSDC